jgi:sulfate adenylyltransferase subunit 2
LQLKLAFSILPIRKYIYFILRKMNYHLNHLKELEAESIFVLREVAAQFENPVLMFSGGKDSILMVYLAQKAFYPSKIPFPLLHVDTGHNFSETIEYRDSLVEKIGAKLIVGSVQEAIDKGMVREEKGINASRNGLQTVALLEALEAGKYDAAMGGARRDEEKARAKERFFSHRDEFGQWDPKNQRPELWNIFNGKKQFGEHFRIFPISNWTELDVWQYLAMEKVDLPSLYFAHKRNVFKRDGILLAESEFIERKPEEKLVEMMVRCRTIGDVTCTGVWESDADNLEKIIEEVSTTRMTERGGRADDKRSETSMEDRKKKGYF